MAAPFRCAFQRGRQRVDVDHRAARGVDEHGALLHRANSRRRSCLSWPPSGHVHGHRVRHFKQGVQRGRLTRVAQRQLRVDVVEHHRQAELLGQHADLRANVAITPRCPASCRELRAIGRALGPAAAMEHRVLSGCRASTSRSRPEPTRPHCACWRKAREDGYAAARHMRRLSWLVPIRQPTAASLWAWSSTSAREVGA